MRCALGALLLLLAGCGPSLPPTPPAAGGCAVEKLADIPVTMQRNGPLVDAEINDWPVTLLLDTGAQITTIRAEIAPRIQLRRAAQGGGAVQGVGGTAPAWPARARVFSFAGVALRDYTIRIAPLRLTLPGPKVADGVLGADILAAYDLDFDFAHNRLGLYRARTCPDGVPDWTFPALGMEMLTAPAGRILLPAELDGVPFAAVVDTGSEMSVVARQIALRTGRGAEELDAGAALGMNGVGGQPVTGRVVRFGTIRIGRLLARGPLLAVAPSLDRLTNGILGMDFLRGRRVWVSYASRRVFVALPPEVVAGR